MPNVLIPPETETFPNRFRWKVADCYRLVDAGFLDGRFELIDGQIISRMGQLPSHRLTVMLIREWLITIFGSRYVQEEKPITLPGDAGIYTEPEPDLAVTSQPTTFYVNRHPTPLDLLLAVEVSDTTLRFDLTYKAPTYARSGVQEYWVLDITNRRLYIHLEPNASGYAEVSVYDTDATVTLSSRPDVSVPVSTFFFAGDVQSE
jgi:Uma2 family endonuclease